MKQLKYFLILVLLGTSINGFAQQDKHEKIRSMRAEIYSRVLELTPEEAEKFWPVFNEYQEERANLRKEMKADREKMKNRENLSDKEADALIDRHLEHEQRQLDLKKKYMAEFRKVLPAKKVAIMPRAEREFKRELIYLLREYRKDEGGSSKMRGPVPEK